MTAAIIEGLKTIAAIPARGEQSLSVNLALVDFTELAAIALELQFKPELVQIPYRFGTQIHALLWQGKIDDAPADLEARIETLSEHITPDAIRSVRGRWTQVA
jgi:hypothetical protein